MAQHKELDVLEVNGPAATDQQPQQRDERAVDEGHEHPAILSRAHSTPDSSQISVLAPFSPGSRLSPASRLGRVAAETVQRRTVGTVRADVRTPAAQPPRASLAETIRLPIWVAHPRDASAGEPPS